MRVSNKGFLVRECDAEMFGTGVHLASVERNEYHVHFVAYADGGDKRLEISLSPDELDKIVEAREKMIKWNAGVFT